VSTGQIGQLILSKDNPSTLEHSARTAVAAVLSLLVARLFRLPEAYWASISTLIVMQSTLGAALPISAQRLAGTAMGVIAGGFAAAYFPGNALVFGIAVFLLGILCAGLRVERGAYRYASVAVAIITLVPRADQAWIIAVHRFVEVSIGIAVGLAITAFWPEHRSRT
jgi:uncharacterized membrane protein YgaE (UPF0421/DUF939 family)